MGPQRSNAAGPWCECSSGFWFDPFLLLCYKYKHQSETSNHVSIRSVTSVARRLQGQVVSGPGGRTAIDGCVYMYVADRAGHPQGPNTRLDRSTGPIDHAPTIIKFSTYTAESTTGTDKVDMIEPIPSTNLRARGRQQLLQRLERLRVRDRVRHGLGPGWELALGRVHHL